MSIAKIVLFSLFVIFVPNFISAEPLALTDKTWKDMLCGQWMVEFYAPWCPSCEHFKPTWEQFSKAMISKDIKVAAIDINQYPSLSGRFRISVLPTIYYVRDGEFRQFHGERSLKGLNNYIEFEEWRRTQPMRSYLAPDSILMSLVGSIFDVSVLVKDAYNLLHDQYGWPAWLIYIVFAVGVIILGLVLGFGVLMLLDFCVNVTPTDYTAIPDDSKEGEEFEESELPLSKSTKRPKIKATTVPSSPTLVASSTPHRPATVPKNRSLPVVEIQDDEALLDEVLAADPNEEASEELEASDVSRATDEDADQEIKKTTTTTSTITTTDNDQSLHRRRANKK